MHNIRQISTTIFILALFATASQGQSCQPPTTNQLFANSITLSSARLNCNAIAGVSLYQFRYRPSNSNTWTLGTSSSQNFAYLTDLLSYTGYQFQCRLFCGGAWTAYSSSQTFTTNSGGNSCNNPNEIACGNTYSGSNNTGNYYYTSYSYAGSTNMTGPEAMHRLSIAYPALVSITMTPLTQDLDMFLLSTCGNSNGLASSQNGYTNSEQITMNLSVGTYYIIVDGWNGAVSNYTLSIQCTQTTVCATPAYSDLYTTNLTCNSVRLNSSAPGAYVWAWAYRPINSANWTTLTNTSTYYTDVYGLQPNTTYEFINAIRCSNDVWSSWSPALQFTTPSCGGSNNSCSNPSVVYCGNTYSGNNGTGSNNYNAYSGSGVSFSQMYGPEVFYQITLSQGGPLNISLTGLAYGQDLDLILLSNCNSNSIVAYSGNGGNSSEYINAGYIPAGTYRLVVDGWNYSVSNYSLSIQCSGSGGGGCQAPAASQLFASNLAGNAARLNCTYQGVTNFYWRYRATGSNAWIDLGSTTTNYINLTNLIPYTDYEFQCSVYCNGNWTSWSSSQYFNSTFPLNNEPCSAYELYTAGGCYPVIGTNIGASTTWTPTPPANCNTLNMKDVWFKVLIPSTGKVKIFTAEGSLHNAVVAFYYGYCNNMTPGTPTCFDNIGDDFMPDVTLTGQPGTWWYIRVWGYDGTTGTFSICAQTLNGFTGDEIVVTQGDDPGDRGAEPNIDMSQQKFVHGEGKANALQLYPVPAQDEIKVSTALVSESDLHVRIASMTGQIMQEETILNAPAGKFEATVDIGRLPSGTYLLFVQSNDGQSEGKFIKL